MAQSSFIDIITPVMVGPSSSHTAGAVRLGLLARNVYDAKPHKITFRLYNSYAQTGFGHGTDKGLLAGVLGLSVDDKRIRNVFDLPEAKLIAYEFEYLEDFNRHPNAVDFIFEGDLNMFVAGFLGSPATSFIKGVYRDGHFDVGDLHIKLPDMYLEGLKAYDGKEVVLGIRPEDIYAEGIVEETYPTARFKMDIEVAELLGHEYILHGSIEGQELVAKVASRLDPKMHDTLDLTMDLSKVHFYDIDTQKRID